MFGIYIHIPFCEKKCSYCDFYSIERVERVDAFAENLIREISLRGESGSRFPAATSVFFGGGTPSLLPPKYITRIFDALFRNFSISDDVEITMECNPGTITLESLRGYRSAGVNRLSFGVQSFHEAELEFLDRIHSPDEAREAVRLARSAGFDNVNIDLMFALPPQTLESWHETLRSAVALEIEHISAYSLIYEEGTPLFARLSRGQVRCTDEETDARMYAEAINYLDKNGFKQYEVSNFARSGRECRHNLTYWNGEEYLAFGPSAHGCIDKTRYWNYRNLALYNKSIDSGKLPIANSETLSLTERMFERAFLEIRAQGIRLDDFHKDFGIDVLSALGNDLQIWIKNGLLYVCAGRLSLASAGYSVCDELTTRIIAILETAAGKIWEISEYGKESTIS
ncbi:MAG: radical SAM family heme chaperone HemW [Bacteroidetes bacterium]|nr:radical SAM family heme chaperone HemW [Bacteroidota bacterium]